MCSINQYHMSFRDIKCKGQIFFVILGHFLPFDPPNNPKNQNFEKIKKTPKYVVILHLHTTNDNHIWFLRYQAWQTELFVILGYFLPFLPYFLALYTSVPKIMIMCYINAAFHFGQFPPPRAPKQPKKWQFQKNVNNAW